MKEFFLVMSWLVALVIAFCLIQFGDYPMFSTGMICFGLIFLSFGIAYYFESQDSSSGM